MVGSAAAMPTRKPVRASQYESLMGVPFAREVIKDLRSPQLPYARRVFVRFFGIIEANKRLSQAAQHMGHFPAAVFTKRKGIDRHDWMDYHHAMYSVSFVTVSDCALLLVNELMQLGLPESACKRATVAQNTNVARTALGQALVKLMAVVQPLTGDRNLVVHRAGRQPIPEIDDWEMTRVVRALTGDHLLPDLRTGKNLHPRAVEMMFRLQRRDLVRRLDKQIADLLRVEETFFEACLEPYRARRDALHS